MKNTIKQSLLATTLVLALATFSGWAQAHDSDREDGKGHHHCHGCHHHHHGRHHEFMDKLGITPEQHKQFEAIREDEHTQAEPLMKSMGEKHRELREYMASPDANEEGASAKAHEISQIEDQLMQLHIQTRFKLREVLTPEQHEKISQWRQERKAGFEHRRSEWNEAGRNDSKNEGETPMTNIKTE